MLGLCHMHDVLGRSVYNGTLDKFRHLFNKLEVFRMQLNFNLILTRFHLNPLTSPHPVRLKVYASL